MKTLFLSTKLTFFWLVCFVIFVLFLCLLGRRREADGFVSITDDGSSEKTRTSSKPGWSHSVRKTTFESAVNYNSNNSNNNKIIFIDWAQLLVSQ